MIYLLIFLLNLLTKDVYSHEALVNIEERMDDLKMCLKVCSEILLLINIDFN